MADMPKVGAGDGARPRYSEMRFDRREMLTLHDALKRWYVVLVSGWAVDR